MCLAPRDSHRRESATTLLCWSTFTLSLPSVLRAEVEGQEKGESSAHGEVRRWQFQAWPIQVGSRGRCSASERDPPREGLRSSQHREGHAFLSVGGRGPGGSGESLCCSDAVPLACGESPVRFRSPASSPLLVRHAQTTVPSKRTCCQGRASSSLYNSVLMSLALLQGQRFHSPLDPQGRSEDTDGGRWYPWKNW